MGRPCGARLLQTGHVSVDTDPRRLPVGNQPEPVEARMTHTFDDGFRCAGEHFPPNARKLDWSR